MSHFSASDQNQAPDPLSTNHPDLSRRNVLLIAPFFDRNVPGESWSTYQWVNRLSRATSATVLTTHKPGWDPTKSPIAAKAVINWDDIRLPKKLARLDHELKPGYMIFYLRCRKWIKAQLAAGATFDLVHQINPLALRYPCPAAGLGLKVIMGPHAGSLPNPPGFDTSATDKSWFRRLRSIDSFRFRRDPWLRRTFAQAELVLGVAPYVKDLLSAIPLKDFSLEGETGVESLSNSPPRKSDPTRPLKLLYVGRIIRTKGLIDAIRALGKIADQVAFDFDILGDGDMRAACEAESKRLGLENRIHFRGRISREQVFTYYQSSDLFVFPSFREPSGNVVFEALGNGLPVLTTNLGGPGHVVDETCGIRVGADSPDSLVENLAAALERVHKQRELITIWSAGAIKRMEQLALWDLKVARLLNHYDRIGGKNENNP